METTNLDAQAAGLDRESIGHIIQQLPYDCLHNTRTGFHLETRTPTGTRYSHAYCHTLQCRTCVRIRYQTMLQALLQACCVHHLTYFVTLTLRSSTSAAALLSRYASRFLSEARRTFDGLQYCWMVGVGRRGNPHLHLLVNRDIRRAPHYGTDREWLRRTWCHLTGAHQTKLEAITPGTEHRVINYMLLDMFRSVLSGLPIGRRYSSSRLIKLNPKPVRNPDAPRYERRRGATGALLRQMGLDTDPFQNQTFEVDAQSTSQRGVEPPLCNGCAASGAPAGGRDQLGLQGDV